MRGPSGRGSAPIDDVRVGDMLRFPSGNKSHPKRPHAHVVARVTDGDVIVVPICSRRDDIKDPLCPIAKGEIDADIVSKPSYARFTDARPTTQASIKSQVERGRCTVKRCQPSWRGLVERIVEGLDGRETEPEMRRRLERR